MRFGRAARARRRSRPDACAEYAVPKTRRIHGAPISKTTTAIPSGKMEWRTTRRHLWARFDWSLAVSTINEAPMLALRARRAIPNCQATVK